MVSLFSIPSERLVHFEGDSSQKIERKHFLIRGGTGGKTKTLILMEIK